MKLRRKLSFLKNAKLVEEFKKKNCKYASDCIESYRNQIIDISNGNLILL